MSVIDRPAGPPSMVQFLHCNTCGSEVPYATVGKGWIWVTIDVTVDGARGVTLLHFCTAGHYQDFLTGAVEVGELPLEQVWGMVLTEATHA